ncbi:RES family NAD+ phosphorylase [Mucilaginibacter pedocola]|uniref:RES domain-containing protein n=1 Tax=Mucilaginibacter pedocola TaxID=1792845 RepID=A0A1S9PKK6_9SPHI|nr:RES family NAD+ phosphorylase [Mucilaginibacter pedocola]OOQ61459.1 hypothetical protein BC343_21085 [Mucilaginibacter pedocola]
MLIYRISKSKKHAKDLSGFGAFKFGGRWNSAGTYILYTSENSSLAFLENLVHFDSDNIPPELFLTQIEINVPEKLIYTLPDRHYPKDWMQPENIANQIIGDKLMSDEKYIAVRFRSVINRFEYNLLLNPLFKEYHDMVKVRSVDRLIIDTRLLK